MKLLMNKNLALLLSGQFVSQIGDKFYMLALAIWVLDTTNSPAMMGAVLFYSSYRHIDVPKKGHLETDPEFIE